MPSPLTSYPTCSKRIIIQRRCPCCKGSGLVQRGRYLRKCPVRWQSGHAHQMLDLAV